MDVTTEHIAIGGVDYVDIDGTPYPISDSGCTIEKHSEMVITPVVGRPEPRIREAYSYYTLSVSMLENTLEMLKLAWNLPNTISYGGSYDYLYLGINEEPGTHAVTVRGWGSLSASGAKEWREWYFRKATSYETHTQDLGPYNTVYIPVTFYCYADSTQISGQEFGWARKLA